MTTATATIVLNSDTYVTRGSIGVKSHREFADTFRNLGGVECGITIPSHLYVNAIAGAPVMFVTGTPEAVAYVESVLV